jgi:hypothetical protein
MKKFRLLLLDANVVIVLCKWGLWGFVLEKCEIHCHATMDRGILLHFRRRRLLRDQKTGLMQKLLTGAVQVKLPEGGA